MLIAEKSYSVCEGIFYLIIYFGIFLSLSYYFLFSAFFTNFITIRDEPYITTKMFTTVLNTVIPINNHPTYSFNS